MLRRLAALVAALVVATASSAAGAPRASAATQAKVVIVVGPAGSATTNYRTESSALATEARKYTSDVTTLFSPNATWELVRPALQGANVVIYMGHGNGFPSPYSTTLMPDRQDGLGLNPYVGSGDITTKYWGESYLASAVKLAPNAVVLLHHLCYASGNSEPGAPQPTVDVAIQRADNMAAGWYAAGARAVIADGHYGSVYYLRSIFTTHQSVDALWHAAPSAHRNDIPFPSARRAGAVGILDPDDPTSYFYRSILVKPGLTTDEILAGADPAISGDGTAPLDTIPPSLTPIGTALDRASLSPNGDGVGESVGLTVSTAEEATLDVAVIDATGATIRGWSQPSQIGRTTIRWDGRTDAGAVAADGRYSLTVGAHDAAGNRATALVKPLILYGALGWVASSAAAIWAKDPAHGSPTAADLSFRLLAPATASLVVLDATGATVRRLLAPTLLPAGAYTYRWDGRDASGAAVRTSTYRASILATGAPGIAIRQNLPLGVGPFRLTANVSAAVRGGSLTLTIAGARRIAALPVVTVYQSGLTARPATVAASGTTGDRWTSRISVPTGPYTGTLSVRVLATENGLTFGTWLRLPLR